MKSILPDSDATRKRMSEILLFVDLGCSVSEIAHDLYLSERSVVHFLRLAVSTMSRAQTAAAQALLDSLDEEATK